MANIEECNECSLTQLWLCPLLFGATSNESENQIKNQSRLFMVAMSDSRFNSIQIELLFLSVLHCLYPSFSFHLCVLTHTHTHTYANEQAVSNRLC